MKKKLTLALMLCILAVLLAGCKCEHEWQSADCTTPKTCAKCGETEGVALGHTWANATCTEAKHCTVCGLTEGEALGHDWADATCTEAQTCRRCDRIEGLILGHQWIKATCEHPRQCSVCNEVDGEALPHTVDEWETTREATCTQVGLMEGICQECGASVTMETSLIDHIPGDWEVTEEATESTPGKRIRKCTVCGNIVEEEEFELTAEEIKANYIKKCGTYTYKDIARNPGAYKGEYAKFSGKVIQVMQQDYFGLLAYVLRVNVNGTYSDTLYVTYFASEDDPRILDGDRITMYGKLDGEKTYETVRGDSVTIPQFNAEYIDIN